MKPYPHARGFDPAEAAAAAAAAAAEEAAPAATAAAPGTVCPLTEQHAELETHSPLLPLLHQLQPRLPRLQLSKWRFGRAPTTQWSQVVHGLGEFDHVSRVLAYSHGQKY